MILIESWEITEETNFRDFSAKITVVSGDNELNRTTYLKFQAHMQLMRLDLQHSLIMTVDA
jgi:hypothetical protein